MTRDGRLGVGIIGAGRVGPVLGAALAGAGHALVGITQGSDAGAGRGDPSGGARAGRDRGRPAQRAGDRRRAPRPARGTRARSGRGRCVAAGAARPAHGSGVGRRHPRSCRREGCHPSRRASGDRVQRNVDGSARAGQRVRGRHGARAGAADRAGPRRGARAANRWSSRRRRARPTARRSPRRGSSRARSCTRRPRSSRRRACRIRGRSSPHWRTPRSTTRSPKPALVRRVASLPLRSKDDQHHRRAARPARRGPRRRTGVPRRPHLDDRLPPRRTHRPGPPGARGRRHRRRVGVRQPAAVRIAGGFRRLPAHSRGGRPTARIARCRGHLRARGGRAAPRRLRDDQGHRRRSGPAVRGTLPPLLLRRAAHRRGQAVPPRPARCRRLRRAGSAAHLPGARG